MDREHKAKEALLRKEKRQADKSLVLLNNTWSNINKDLELLKTERSYDSSIAVNDAKREERCHYTSIVQAQKDQGHKLKSLHP